jgi:hypothetical protein
VTTRRDARADGELAAEAVNRAATGLIAAHAESERVAVQIGTRIAELEESAGAFGRLVAERNDLEALPRRLHAGLGDQQPDAILSDSPTHGYASRTGCAERLAVRRLCSIRSIQA